MAQIDSGLGWLANEEWMVAAANYLVGNVSDISGANMLVCPEAVNWTAEAVIREGIKYGHNNGNNTDNYILSRYGEVLIAFNNQDDYETPIAISTSSSIECMICGKTLAGTVNGTWTFSGSYYDSTTGLYWARPSSLPRSHIVDVPPYANRRAMLDAVTVVSANFYKENQGYAVACVAKWLTQNGTELISPILISSNTEFVDMTTNASGYNIAKLNYLLSGVRFYMAFWDIPGSISVTTDLEFADLTGRGNMSLDQLFMTLVSTSYAHVTIINSPDPYETEGGGSGEEGGDGEDLDDDEMGISHHAIPAAINTGFCRIYCPNEQQLRDLSNFLWSAQYDLTAVKKLFANPMDSVLGLSAVPLNLSGANAAVYLGGVDTEMSFPMVSYQSYQVPMGAITVEKRWGSYLDYDPYTRFSIFLPFIGFKDLSADDIMGKQIILDYDVDILSGACTARLQAGGNVLYQWSGQCSIQLPVTASNWNQVFQGATSAALSAGLAVATGSAGPVLAGALAAEGVQAIMGKPRIERGGTASGAAGWMGGLTPYLVRVTPEAIIPSDQNKFIGYPAFSSISLGALTGYNEISSIHLEGIPATGAELDELEAILKGGVIF